MALNYHSKHGIIIGVVTIIASLLMLLVEIPRMKMAFHPNDYDIIYSSPLIVELVGILILALLAAVLSGLLILGIVKKRHLLLAPWLVIGILLSVCVSTTVIYRTVTSTYSRLDNYIFIVILIGLQVIVLYPICHLFTEIRKDNAAVGDPKQSQSNYVSNIQNTFDEVSQKSIV